MRCRTPKALQFPPLQNLAVSGCAGANYVIAVPSWPLLPQTSAHWSPSRIGVILSFSLWMLSEPQQIQPLSQNDVRCTHQCFHKGYQPERVEHHGMIRHVGRWLVVRAQSQTKGIEYSVVPSPSPSLSPSSSPRFVFTSAMGLKVCGFQFHCSTRSPPCSSGGPLLGMVTKKAADSFCRAESPVVQLQPGPVSVSLTRVLAALGHV